MGTRHTQSWAQLAALAFAVVSCAQGSLESASGSPALDGIDAGSSSPADASVGQPPVTAPDPVGASPDAASPSVADDAGVTEDAGGTSAEDAGSVLPPGTSADAGTPTKPVGTDAGGNNGVAPATCAQANEQIGCCVGNELYYCNKTTAPTSKACAAGKVCAWDSASSYYDCVAPPGSADPSGANPLSCP